MWSSKKQNKVTTSTAEAEYALIAQAMKEATWLQNLFLELGFPQREPTIIFGDNQYHLRFQQFNIKNHCVHEKIKWKVINVWHYPTSQMTADIMTKPLLREASCQHIADLSMASAWGGVLSMHYRTHKQAEMLRAISWVIISNKY